MSDPESQDLMRTAFVRRMNRVVEDLSRTANDSTIMEALSIPDAVDGLAWALQRANGPAHGLGRDPLAGARIRGANSRKRLIERAGGLLRLNEAASLLNVSRRTVTRRRVAGTILAVPTPRIEWMYPVQQFEGDDVVPGLSEFLRHMGDAGPWTRLSVLLAPSTRFRGASALDLLRAGKLGQARSIAHSYGRQG